MIFTHNNFTSVLLKQILKDKHFKLERLHYSIVHLVEDLYSYAQYLLVNTNICNFLSNDNYESVTEKNIAIYTVIDEIRRLNKLKEYIHSVALINTNNDAFWTSSPFDNYFQVVLLNNDISFDFGNKTTIIFSKPYTLSTNAIADPIKVITCFVPIKRVDRTIGYIAINIKHNYISNLFVTYESEFDNILLRNVDGIILYKNGSDIDYKLYKKYENYRSNNVQIIEQSDGYLFVSGFEDCKWALTGFLSKKSIFSAVKRSSIIFLVIILLISLLSIGILFLPLLWRIVKPIIDMNKTIKAVAQGDFNAKIELDGAVEYKELAKGFNKMVIDLNQYMNACIQNMKEKQNIAFNLLLAQINPHFIYNTLNSVVYLARKKKTDEIINMMNSFIYLLQDTIHLGEQEMFNTLEKEIKIIKYYSVIQKYRYIKKFDIFIDVDDQLNDVLVPKFLLQPLVENSILHGACPKNGKCIINICAKEITDQQRIIISVKDNGVGMDKDTIDRILNSNQNDILETSNGGFKSIGLVNIIGRLKYLYKDNFSISIESNTNETTNIIINIPKMTNI